MKGDLGNCAKFSDQELYVGGEESWVQIIRPHFPLE